MGLGFKLMLVVSSFLREPPILVLWHSMFLKKFQVLLLNYLLHKGIFSKAFGEGSHMLWTKDISIG